MPCGVRDVTITFWANTLTTGSYLRGNNAIGLSQGGVSRLEPTCESRSKTRSHTAFAGYFFSYASFVLTRLTCAGKIAAKLTIKYRRTSGWVSHCRHCEERSNPQQTGDCFATNARSDESIEITRWRFPRANGALRTSPLLQERVRGEVQKSDRSADASGAMSLAPFSLPKQAQGRKPRGDVWDRAGAMTQTYCVCLYLEGLSF
jgi:hypothetical protein